MAACPDTIKRLIERFDHQADLLRSPDYNEAQLRIDFINPLFTELGWDIDNKAGNAEQYREVFHEDRVKVAGQTKAPDYSFRIGGVRKFFLEAKKPSVKIKEALEPAYQLRRYGWSAKLAVSLLTNFAEFAIYDCRIAPKHLDKSTTARREYFGYHDYPDRWDFLEGTFSKRAVLQGDFDRYCQSTKGRGRQEFDDKFLEEIENWRRTLANNLALRNETIDESGLNFSVQRIIDRIIFLRIAEDRGTEPTGQLQALLNGEQVYQRLGKLFRDADARYNSGLFHFALENGRDETPDTLTPGLDVDDKTLKDIIRRLYYPESPYEFTVVTVDLLGSVYERFLGHVISLTPGHRAKIEEKPEVRKAGGVYYTPAYIVDYIVKNTVGKLLAPPNPEAPDVHPGPQLTPIGPVTAASSNSEAPDVYPGPQLTPIGPVTAASSNSEAPDVHPGLRVTPKQAAKLKILDPACGSGSFLIGAYQYLLDWHLDWYTQNDPEKWTTGRNPVLRQVVSTPDTPNYRLTIAERKRILLDNIHGVDLDASAVEVTKLNLLLKCLEGETTETLGFHQRLFRERALPDLGHNILCGNSLIGTDIMATDAWKQMSDEEKRRINPFDYDRAFPQVFKHGGFDAVIGNPPYIRIQNLTNTSANYFESKYDAAIGKYDIYLLFVEMALRASKSNGNVAFILPNKFFTADYGKGLRAELAKCGAVDRIVDFGDAQVFANAVTYTCILFLTRNSPRRQWASLRTASSEAIGLVEHNSYWNSFAFPSEDGGPWHLAKKDTQALFLKFMDQRLEPLGTVADRIFQGLISGADSLFYLPIEQTRDLGIEPEILHPVLKGKEVRRYFFEPCEYQCLFPYQSKEGRTELIEERRLRSVYPKAYRYLASIRRKLEDRGSENMQYSYWYAYWCERAINAFESPKLVTQVLAKGGKFAYDNAGEYFFVGGGNAGVYGITIPIEKQEEGFSYPYVLGLLNSKACDWLVRQISTHFRGGYYSYAKRFIQRVRMVRPLSNRTLTTQISASVERMAKLRPRLQSENLPHHREQLQREIDATDRQIDQLVYELYGLTDDEIRIVEEETT